MRQVVAGIGIDDETEIVQRARQSAQRALKGFLLSVGFRQVRFVDSLPRIEPG